jgi:hypothetical protein
MLVYKLTLIHLSVQDYHKVWDLSRSRSVARGFFENLGYFFSGFMLAEAAVHLIYLGFVGFSSRKKSSASSQVPVLQILLVNIFLQSRFLHKTLSSNSNH